MPNKLAELVNFLHFLLHTHTSHTYSPHSFMYSPHSQLARVQLAPRQTVQGKAAKWQQQSSATFRRFFYFLFYFTFYALFLLLSSLRIFLQFFYTIFFIVGFVLVYFRNLFAARAFDFLLSFSATASAVVVSTKYNGEMLNLCCRSMQFICGKVPTRRRR